MPYDEFDQEDPLELVGCQMPLDEEHLTEMAECFIEEFARMGYSADALLELFHNSFYRGPHSVYQVRGEEFVRDLIEQMVGERPVASPAANRLVQDPADGGCFKRQVRAAMAKLHKNSERQNA